jgi:hypothetical protein
MQRKSSETNDFVDEKDIASINVLLQNAHPDQKFPKIEKRTFGVDNCPCLYIPVELYTYANINIDPRLKDVMTFYTDPKDKEKKQYLVVPDQIKLGFVDATNTT